jgi:TolA-binding protein
MDSNLITALVTSVTAAGSTAGVAITALLLSNKRIDRVEAALDRLTSSVDARLESVDARLESLTGSMHDIDKRLSIIEDRVGRA